MKKLRELTALWRIYCGKRKEERLKDEAEAIMQIGDYTDSKGELHTAILVHGIPTEYLSTGTVEAMQRKLVELRVEFVDKRMGERGHGQDS